MATATEGTSQRIAANARAICARQNIKRDTLARRAGIDIRKVYRLLSGTQKWSAEDIEAVAAGLKVDWIELVTTNEAAA